MKLRLLLIAAALLPAFFANAQYEVGITLDKINYIIQEPMIAKVTIVNRSGADVILGGPTGKAWLVFNLKDSTDRSLSPAQATSDEPVALRAGERTTRSVRITETHAITDPGTYSLTVSAYHPPSGDYYVSNRQRFTVTDAKPYKEPLVFGVPAGFPGAGKIRRHVLMINRDSERSYLYYRLVDDRTNEKLLTYQLGPVSVVRDPQFTLDKGNALHVMFLATPDQTVHYTVGPDGKPKNIEYYRDTPDTRPMLFLTHDNEVVAQGGKKFDPAAEREALKAGPAQKTRNVSERPPGL